MGGTLNYTQDLANHAGGRINAINAELTFTGGLTNLGELNLINSTVNGSVSSSSAVAVSGTNTFSGAVSGPANFTGNGKVVFEGSYAGGQPGRSELCGGRGPGEQQHAADGAWRARRLGSSTGWMCRRRGI